MTELDLMEHAAWLRRLARSLVRDASAADDVVQETWVAAWRSPPRGDRPVRPWLRQVLRNAARFRWRGEANRAAREREVAALADDATPSAEELLERHETQQLLARLVGELEEPFRATVLLCYAEGLAPTEVARRLGVPAGTIRSRLHEGLARLRARLDALHRGDRRAWMLALGPLANRSAPPAAAASPLIGWALAALAAAALVLVGLHAAGGAVRETAAPRVVRGGGPMSAVARSAVATLATQDLVGLIAQEGAPARTVAGHVTIDGAPAAGVVVQLTTDLSDAGVAPKLEQRTSADGAFAFPAQPASVICVAAAAPGHRAAITYVDLRDPTARADAVDLAIRPCFAALAGTVVDAAGLPIVHAHLLRGDVIGTETDAAGAYELCTASYGISNEELTLAARADGYGAAVFETGLDGRMRHDFVLGPEAVVTGRAAPFARVWIERDRTARPQQEFAASQIAFADGDGRFRIAGLAAGDFLVSASAHELAAPPTRLTLVPGGTQDIVIALEPTATVRGHVTHAGTPVAGARISIGMADAISQLDGSFVLARVPAGTATFTASPYRVISAPVKIAAGGDTRVELEVELLGVVAGTVRRHASAVPYARVCAGTARARNTCANTDASGHYELVGLEAGAYTLFSDDDAVGARAPHVEFSLAAGEHRTLDVELAAGGRVAGEVVDTHGAPVAGAFVRFVEQTSTPHLFDESRCMTGADGAFECTALEGATYTVAVFAGSEAAGAFLFAGPPPAPIAVADGDARISGLHLAVDATRLPITGTLADASGAPVPDARLRIWSEDGAPDHLRAAASVATDADGRFQFRDLAPGAYTIEARAVEGTMVVRHDVAAGAARVALVLDAGECHLGSAPPLAMRPSARIAWDDRIELVGWDMPAHVALGQRFEVALTYHVLRPLDRAWTIFVHFDGKEMRRVADHDPACPTLAWRAGDYVVERFTTTIDHVAPGPYAMAVGFFAGSAPTWTNLPVSDAPAAMRAGWSGVTLGRIDLGAAALP